MTPVVEGPVCSSAAAGLAFVRYGRFALFCLIAMAIACGCASGTRDAVYVQDLVDGRSGETWLRNERYANVRDVLFVYTGGDHDRGHEGGARVFCLKDAVVTIDAWFTYDCRVSEPVCVHSILVKGEQSIKQKGARLSTVVIPFADKRGMPRFAVDLTGPLQVEERTDMPSESTKSLLALPIAPLQFEDDPLWPVWDYSDAERNSEGYMIIDADSLAPGTVWLQRGSVASLFTWNVELPELVILRSEDGGYYVEPSTGGDSYLVHFLVIPDPLSPGTCTLVGGPVRELVE